MTTPAAARTFDYRPRFDDRSLAYGVRGLVATPVPRVSAFWPVGPVLDQGEEGACVGHGWAHEAAAHPFPVDLTKVTLPEGWPDDLQAFAFHLYEWCKDNDQWPGDAYSGTSVLAGAKGMALLGLVTEYRWAHGVEELIDALIALGPAVLGIPWLSGMYVAPGGWLRVHGEVVGGHCILAVGYDPAHKFPDGSVCEGIAVQNSWGPDFGVNGIAWIKKDDLAPLLANKQGEACIPLVRSLGELRDSKPRPRVCRLLDALRRWVRS